MTERIKQGVLMLFLSVSIALVLPTLAKKTTKSFDGKQLFQQNCASCHQDGGNKVNPDRPVAGSKELATLASFKNYLKAPPGHMPYYQHIVNDDAILKALYTYCKGLKREPLKQASL